MVFTRISTERIFFCTPQMQCLLEGSSLVLGRCLIESWTQQRIVFTMVLLTIIPQAQMGSERPKAEWAIDSEAMRVRGIIIVSVKSN